MPAHIALNLTPEEIVDVVAFLRSKPAQDALKQGPRRVDRAIAIGPFEPGADRHRIPLDRVELSRVYEGQEGSMATWIGLEASHHGLFNLRGEMAAKPGRAYLASEIKSAGAQTVALRFAVEGSARVYLNGAKVAEVSAREGKGNASAFARPPAHGNPSLPDLARLNLKAGANLLMVATDRPDDDGGDLRAVLEVLSPDPVEIRTPQNAAEKP